MISLWNHFQIQAQSSYQQQYQHWFSTVMAALCCILGLLTKMAKFDLFSLQFCWLNILSCTLTPLLVKGRFSYKPKISTTFCIKVTLRILYILHPTVFTFTTLYSLLFDFLNQKIDLVHKIEVYTFSKYTVILIFILFIHFFFFFLFGYLYAFCN